MAGSKKGLSVVIGLGKPKPGAMDEAEESPESERTEDAGLRSAVQAFMDAVSSGDVDAATDALKSAVALCSSEPGEY